MTQVADYRKSDGVGAGYFIESGTTETGDTRYRWGYTEAGDTDFGPWFSSLPTALRDAAEDWEDNGSSTPRHAAVLRGAATRAEKKESR